MEQLFLRTVPAPVTMIGIPLAAYYLSRAAPQMANGIAMVSAFVMSQLITYALDARNPPALLAVRWMGVGGAVVTGARLIEVIAFRGVLTKKKSCRTEFFAALFLLDPRPRRSTDPPAPSLISLGCLPKVFSFIVAVMVAARFEKQVAEDAFWESCSGMACAITFSYAMGVMVMHVGRFTEHLQFRFTNMMCGTVSNEESYSDPFSAVSIRDLWSNRWNGLMKDLYKRLVFVNIRVLGASSLTAAVVTFLFSGLLHDWWNYLAFGTRLPYQSAFFLIQSLLVAIEIKLRAVWPPAQTGLKYVFSRAVTTVLLSLTGILFMFPYAQAGLARSLNQAFKGDMVIDKVISVLSDSTSSFGDSEYSAPVTVG